MGIPTDKRTLGRPRCGWESNVKMYLKEMGINTRNWVDSAQDRDYWRALVNFCTEPLGFINHGISYISR